jgi:hypothetical protein
LVRQVRLLYRRGENRRAIARALGIASDTARRWLDPDYQHQRSFRCAVSEEPELPTLPFVPGVVVSGRYRMQEPGE